MDGSPPGVEEPGRAVNVVAKLLGRVRRKMLSVGLPAVLDDLDGHGVLRAASILRPRSLG